MAKVRKASDGRCRVVADGLRCLETVGLEGHHAIALRKLWDLASSRAEFVRMACDPSGVYLVCPSHHRLLDRQD
jgi:hypothetical protein